jgi:hypothetical protein
MTASPRQPESSDVGIVRELPPPFSREGYYFTRHAAQALLDRRLTWRDAINALNDQQDEKPGTHELEGTLVITGTSMSGVLIDVVVEESDRKQIVTVIPHEYPDLPRPRRRFRSRRRK